MAIRQLSDAELNARFTKAYEATHNHKIVDIYAPSLRQRWAEARFLTKLAAIVLIGFIIPWSIIVGGLAVLAVFDAFSR